MKLEQQVTSLALSKRLKELGVKQESIFFWSYYDDGHSKDKPGIAFADNCNLSFMENLVSAFTIAELGERLPEQRYWTTVKTNTGSWRCSEYDENGLAEGGKTSFIADTEAEARGLMLAHLIENKLLNV